MPTTPPPPQVPLWVGSTAVTETPNSPIIEVNVTRFSITRIYEGPYANIVGALPVQGQSFADMPPAVLIVSWRPEKLPGGKGRLTVKAETSGPSTETPFAPLYEVEWVEVDRALEEHPIFNDGSAAENFGDGATPGTYALSIADRAAIQLWESEEDFTLKAQFQFKIPTNSGATAPDGYTIVTTATINNNSYDVYQLTDNGIVLARKKQRGTTSYRVWAPVVRQTIQSPNLPSGDPCGIIEDPPGGASPPDGYKWQRSAQRATKTGRWGMWTLQQEWQGADWIDGDLYSTTGT